MGALIALLPQLLQLMNNPAIQALLPLLSQLGKTAFPNVDPGRAGEAASSLFDSMHTKWVQTALKVLGYTVDIDGVYGDETKAAVTKFQTEHGLDADGWAGEKTNAALRESLLKK